MRRISRLTLELAFACALGASAPARALDEAPKPKAEDSAEQKRDESKDTKSEQKTEKREDKTDAQSEKKAKAARSDKSAEKKKRADNGAYLRKLGQLIRARSPGATNLGEGSAVVRFRLGPSGAPSSVTLVSASTPRHGQLARSIISGLRAPSPPGGSYEGVQSFRFH